MGDAVLEAFSVQKSGDFGKLIQNPDGRTIAWVTDDWAAQVIARLLNENEHLLIMTNTKGKSNEAVYG